MRRVSFQCSSRCQPVRVDRDHSFSTYTKFSEQMIFLLPDTHTCPFLSGLYLNGIVWYCYASAKTFPYGPGPLKWAV